MTFTPLKRAVLEPCETAEDWLDSGQGGPPVLNAWRERVQLLKAAI